MTTVDLKITRAELLLKTLVDAASPTSRQHDVRDTHALLAVVLQELGFQIESVKDSSGKTADLLIATRMPTSPRKSTAENTGTKFLTFVSHIDTVLSPIEAGPYRREETALGLRARGAGIIDNKGGLAVLVESLKLFLETNPSIDVGLRVVSSPDEENGSSAWHETFKKIGEQSAVVLGFEPALDDGSIISSRRGNRWYNIEIEGIEAHAGRCRGEELNAAHESARMITRFLDLRDDLRRKFSSPPGLGVSIHVGHVEGGRDRHNVVCGHVRMKLDARFSSFEERDALHEEILKILKSPIEKNLNGDACTVRFEIVDDCPPFAVNSAAEEVVTKLTEEIARFEKHAPLKPAKAGGAGDVNHMSRPGLLVLDGLGPVGGRMHTTDEFMQLSTLESRAQALAAWYPRLVMYAITT